MYYEHATQSKLGMFNSSFIFISDGFFMHCHSDKRKASFDFSCHICCLFFVHNLHVSLPKPFILCLLSFDLFFSHIDSLQMPSNNSIRKQIETLQVSHLVSVSSLVLFSLQWSRSYSGCSVVHFHLLG